MSRNVLAVDVGGTHFRAAVYNDKLEIQAEEHKSIQGISYSDIIAYTLQTILKYKEGFSIDAIGLSLAGHVDVKNGTVSYRQVTENEPKTKDWQYETFRIRDDIQTKTGLPVAIDNDGNAALLAEWKCGVAKDYKNVVELVLGTYVGSGVVANGQIVRRRTSAPLLPAIVTRYGEGFEHLGTLCSGVGFLRAAEQAYGHRIPGKELYELAQKGDAKALQIFQEAGMWLGVLIASSINIFDPEIVVLDGPVMHSARFMMGEAIKVVEQNRLPGIGEPAKIEIGKFIDNAAITGAAITALEAVDSGVLR